MPQEICKQNEKQRSGKKDSAGPSISAQYHNVFLEKGKKKSNFFQKNSQYILLCWKYSDIQNTDRTLKTANCYRRESTALGKRCSSLVLS